ncbi:MAG: hypothetical protein LWX07_01020 [Bacteroidetes bacterium]|nr:hypothetical protein [Bacteroidota bacterium]
MLKQASFIAVFLIAAAVFYSCEKKSDSVIDPSYDSPILTNLVRTPDTVKTTASSPNVQVYVSVIANTNNGAPLSDVKCIVIDPDNNTLINTNLIYVADTATGKKFAATITAGSISCLLVGNYTIQVIASNEKGLSSNMLSSGFIVKNTSNHAPVLSNPSLPDSVVRPLSGSFDLTLSLTGTDADGHCDIQFVYMDAYRPNGLLLGRYPMNYNGNNIYSYTNTVTYAAADSFYGYYKYNFVAIDRSEVFSTIIYDSIKFVRPN